jgi:hypothetical protein
MDRWMVAAFIFAAIAVGMAAQGWTSWLEHKRRSKALDVIKAAIEAGREPPPQLFEQLEADPMAQMGLSKRPWGEALVFGAVGVGFWIALAFAEPDANREKFVLVASIMSAVSIACFALAAFRSRKRDDK